MQTNFLDAHQRHWDDAELLFNGSRWANADQLYGLSAECGLKRLMVAFGMRFDMTKGLPADNKDKVHTNKTWPRYESYRSGHHQGAKLVLPTPNPFIDWTVSQRYAHQSNFDQARVEPHKLGADAVRKLVKKAMLEGLI